MSTAFWALVRKDLRLFFSDRRAVVVGLLVPIICGSFFGYLFGGRKGETEASRMPVLVIDQDQSDVSAAIVVRLGADKNLEVKPSTLQDAQVAVRKGKAMVAIVIPKGFGSDAGRALFYSGAKKPELRVLYDPSHAMESGMVQGILSGAVMQSVSKEMFSGKSGREMVKQSLAEIESAKDMPDADKKVMRDLLGSVHALNEQQDRAQKDRQPQPTTGMTMPYETRAEAITSGSGIRYNGYAHSFGGMGIQFILFMGLDVGLRLLLLRKSGLWQRLRAAPLSRSVLLGSRAISAAMIAAFIMLVLFTFARLVFGVRIQGSLLGFLGICAAFSLMTAAFGLMVAALGKTIEATRGISIMATLIMVMLGGAWVPAFIFPQWLQKATLVVPTRWAMDGLDAMTWRGLYLSAALPPIAVLLLFTAVFGIVAVTRFRWEAEG
jgi:ABC-2 type transport system permease protein